MRQWFLFTWVIIDILWYSLKYPYWLNETIVFVDSTHDPIRVKSIGWRNPTLYSMCANRNPCQDNFKVGGKFTTSSHWTIYFDFEYCFCFKYRFHEHTVYSREYQMFVPNSLMSLRYISGFLALCFRFDLVSKI